MTHYQHKLSEQSLRAHDEFGSPVDAELHGHSLFHGGDDWSLPPRARIAVYARALEVVGESEVELFLRGVDVDGLRERYRYPDHPHSVTLSHLIERLDEWSEVHHGGETIRLIADEHHLADTHKRNLWTFQLEATKGYRSRRIRFVEEITFEDSYSHRLLQAVDLVAFLNQRMHERQGHQGREAVTNNTLWNLVSGRISHRLCWEP